MSKMKGKMASVMYQRHLFSHAVDYETTEVICHWIAARQICLSGGQESMARVLQKIGFPSAPRYTELGGIRKEFRGDFGLVSLDPEHMNVCVWEMFPLPLSLRTELSPSLFVWTTGEYKTVPSPGPEPSFFKLCLCTFITGVYGE